jgi:D-alanyl-D-alanine carboxypeptidase/D-alanyl-D-alanine-endopeptidase (penicillin-binding protein 4)
MLVSLLTAAAVGLRPPQAAADVAGNIDAILHRKQLDGPGTGALIWDLQTGAQVYALHATTPLMPASNVKLVTAAAALWAWGEDHRIPTHVLTDGTLSPDGTLTGDLYLRGLGDPSLSTLRYQRREMHLRTASIEGLVRRLKTRGVRRVHGAVVADDSWFDRRRVVVTWRPGLQEECGRLAALSADEGLRDGNRLRSPALYAAQLLTAALKKAGVKVDEGPRMGATPAGAQLLARQWSAPLAKLIRRMNKDSDNFFAEVLLKGLGRDLYDEGSTDAGLQASRDVLAQIGAEPEAFRLADGSGLSYDNRLTAGDIVRLLVAMYRRDDWEAYRGSLARAAVDGTLADRMQDTAAAGNASAKTGSLADAAALSGYVTSADGHLLAFAIVTNGERLDHWRTTKAHDALVAALAAAELGGETRLRSAPAARQHVRSAADADFVTGRALVPSVEVPES